MAAAARLQHSNPRLEHRIDSIRSQAALDMLAWRHVLPIDTYPFAPADSVDLEPHWLSYLLSLLPADESEPAYVAIVAEASENPHHLTPSAIPELDEALVEVLAQNNIHTVYITSSDFPVEPLDLQ